MQHRNVAAACCPMLPWALDRNVRMPAALARWVGCAPMFPHGSNSEGIPSTQEWRGRQGLWPCLAPGANQFSCVPEGSPRPAPMRDNPKVGSHRAAHLTLRRARRDWPRWLGCVPKAAPRPRSPESRRIPMSASRRPRGVIHRAGPYHPEGCSVPARRSTAPKGWCRDSSRSTPKGRAAGGGEPAESAESIPPRGLCFRGRTNSDVDVAPSEDGTIDLPLAPTPEGGRIEPTAPPRRVAAMGGPPPSEEDGSPWLRPGPSKLG